MTPTLETIVSFAKRRGFVFQGSDLYGGLAGTWDLGPLGAELMFNIKQSWWKRFVTRREDMYGFSSSLIMPEAVWKASGHLEGFTDPMVECLSCKRRFRADHLEDKHACPECKGTLGDEKVFNLLFPVSMGSAQGGTTTAYLRGEVAQGMFVHFKNVLDVHHPKLPFGIAQIGRAFRNEIAPREFLFRVREFELAEFEYFVKEDDWETYFEYWREEMWKWIDDIGITKEGVHELEVAPEDRAHYSKRTIDFEFDFPFGRKELFGLAYRTDHDLRAHQEASNVDLTYLDEATGERFIPHVIEPTFGMGRTLLAILVSSYDEDDLGGEKRVVLRLPKALAPIKAMVSPLLKNKPELIEKARGVYKDLKHEFGAIAWDDNGNIGKRYRRQDEIGTPWCITVDFDTLTDDTVTLRDRDTGEQERVHISDLSARIRASIDA
jgi:glycyl-tRNA synthetase